MTQSNKPVDRRLVNLYKIHLAETRNTFAEIKAEKLTEENFSSAKCYHSSEKAA